MGGDGGCRGSARAGIPARGVVPLNPSFPRKRESRDHCDRKAGIGRTALDCHFPIGLGDKLRGNDGGAVDSRFRGNDRWAGMAKAGMTDGWE